MSDALPNPLPNPLPDIDTILASIRAELGSADPVAPPPMDRRASSVVRVEVLDQDEERFPADTRVFAAADFEHLDELAFLHAAYRVVLGRDIDESGLAHYLPALRAGHTSQPDILRSLRASPEGQARGIEITGLQRRQSVQRLEGLPVLGDLLARLRRYRGLPHENHRLQKRLAATDRRQRDIVTGVNGALSTVRRSLQKLEQRVNEAEQGAAAAGHRAEAAHALTQTMLDARDTALSELHATRRQLVEQGNQLTRLIDSARQSMPLPSPQQAAPLQAIEDASFDTLYLAFENRFRGSTSVVTERLRRYLDLFRQSEPVAAGGVVLDIGCGRGEWLALLDDANIAARGIDLNGAMAAQAQARGLDVQVGDAIAHLRGLPDGSLAAVTGFHIVEHLAFRDLVGLFDAAYGALAPDGFVLFETPNPENIVVGACTFHYDPTHTKPLPPDFLRFIAETRGFSDVRIIRHDEDCRLDQPESGFEPVELNDWFRQPADYAVFARKAAEDVAS